jgi:hypothetical protein
MITQTKLTEIIWLAFLGNLNSLDLSTKTLHTNRLDIDSSRPLAWSLRCKRLSSIL